MIHSKPHIAIIEDQEDVREALNELLCSEARFASVSLYKSAEQLLQNPQLTGIDLFILDIGLPGMSGLDCLGQIKTIHPKSIVLMYTVMEHDESVFAALSLGADGYLLKREAPEKIVLAIEDAFQGGAPMSSEIARKVLLTFRKPQPTPTPTAALSEREKEVLDLIAKGYLYKEIALQLQITLNTVKQHIHRIYQKLQVQNRTEATLRSLGK